MMWVVHWPQKNKVKLNASANIIAVFLFAIVYVVNGLYGGDVDALTDMYTEQIQQVNDFLDVPTNASVCPQANPDFNPATTDCTLFETGYEYTGIYYEGMFKSPVYYAQVF